MSQQLRSKTVKINQEFICKNCGHANPPANKTCRNHCRHCLYSLHVDAEVPGDRASDCHSLMEPVGIDQKSKKGFIILHKCLKCGKTIFNKVADDDETDAIIKQIRRSGESVRPQRRTKKRSAAFRKKKFGR